MIMLAVILIAAIGWAVIYGLQYAGIRMPWQSDVNEESISSTNNTDNTASAKVTDSTARTNNIVDASTAHTATGSVESDTTSSPKNSADKQVSLDTSDKKSAPSPTAAIAQPANSKHVPVPRQKVAKPAIIWPEAKLKGIVGRGKGGAVMLNDMIIGVGEEEKGIKVIKIESNGVWLEYEKERRFLKVGKSLE
jgi:cytoskeletal protein RodZ